MKSIGAEALSARGCGTAIVGPVTLGGTDGSRKSDPNGIGGRSRSETRSEGKRSFYSRTDFRHMVTNRVGA